eukprot:jgi/Chlat1/6263/Chrsp44S09048
MAVQQAAGSFDEDAKLAQQLQDEEHAMAMQVQELSSMSQSFVPQGPAAPLQHYDSQYSSVPVHSDRHLQHVPVDPRLDAQSRKSCRVRGQPSTIFLVFTRHRAARSWAAHSVTTSTAVS